MINSATESLYLEDYKARNSNKRTDDLDKDAFLKILITQLQNQDPLNPMEDKEFIAQMAQFSTLEQMANISSTLDKLVSAPDQQSFTSYGDMIGKKVEWEKKQTDEAGDNIGIVQSGVVTQVSFKEGKTTFIVDDKHHLSKKEIMSISNP
ncbi:flagellar hook assembly protein FlgD [Alteribacter aurantiacus]|uniref:flagellar hook assembly protein FlgD n=1 Tax=Alteribacter aurantiacus TaxID=254410 RepID=UPI0004123C73|nr:flagellar hook assembly protein FlgD [Alteribacter aurantiacus]